MVEVFKTNVFHSDHAAVLITLIQQRFVEYKANFDLEDCDKVLRVQSATGPIQSSALISLLNGYGFDAEILPDDVEPIRDRGLPTAILLTRTRRFMNWACCISDR
ncbi:hypothetical protein [Spirosoma fluminis]